METEGLILSAEICEDVWSPVPPSIKAALEGAVILVNCSASDETIGKNRYREELIKGQSARLIAGYVYANAGEGESTTDVVFGGHNLIAENGTILKASRRFANETIYSEIDIKRLLSERRKNTTFRSAVKRHCRLFRFPSKKRRRPLQEPFPRHHSFRRMKRNVPQDAKRFCLFRLWD